MANNKDDALGRQLRGEERSSTVRGSSASYHPHKVLSPQHPNVYAMHAYPHMHGQPHYVPMYWPGAAMPYAYALPPRQQGYQHPMPYAPPPMHGYVGAMPYQQPRGGPRNADHAPRPRVHNSPTPRGALDPTRGPPHRAQPARQPPLHTGSGTSAPKNAPQAGASDGTRTPNRNTGAHNEDALAQQMSAQAVQLLQDKSRMAAENRQLEHERDFLLAKVAYMEQQQASLRSPEDTLVDVHEDMVAELTTLRAAVQQLTLDKAALQQQVLRLKTKPVDDGPSSSSSAMGDSNADSGDGCDV